MTKIIYILNFFHKNFWTIDKLKSLFFGFLFFLIALLIQEYANNFVSNVNAVAVGDIIHDKLVAIDISGFIVNASLFVSLVISIIIIRNPKYIIFTLKVLSLFIIVRAFFISLTHLGVTAEEIKITGEGISFYLYNLIGFNTHNDFFFSAHTGIPFLMGLILYKNIYFRYFCFTCSFVLGTSMLIGHIHYSIDVFASPFITYSIYKLSSKIFKNDYDLIN